jgi:hypothetical protein
VSGTWTACRTATADLSGRTAAGSLLFPTGPPGCHAGRTPTIPTHLDGAVACDWPDIRPEHQIAADTSMVTDTSVAMCAGHSPSRRRSFRKQRTVNPQMVPARFNCPLPFLKASLRAAASVAALAPATTRRSPWNRLALPLGVAHRAAGRHSAVTATGLGRQQPPGRPGANPLRQQLPMRSMSAGRLARLSGVAGHGLMQVAEGLLDAGVDVVGTVGAVLACSRWLGR